MYDSQNVRLDPAECDAYGKRTWRKPKDVHIFIGSVFFLISQNMCCTRWYVMKITLDS